MPSNLAPERTVKLYGLEIVLQTGCMGEQPVAHTVLDYEALGHACEDQGLIDNLLEDLQI